MGTQDRDRPSAGEPVGARTKHPPKKRPSARIEVHVALIDQLFNSIDPSPFHYRDLDPAADDYIVKCARELPLGADLELRIYLDQTPQLPDRLTLVDRAIHAHFLASAQTTQSQLQDMFRRGRISLLIGLSFLSLSIALSQLLGNAPEHEHLSRILKESMVIGGWVAMWRPMEIFLYDWWPVAARIRLLQRLSRIKVHVHIPQRGVQMPADKA